jgi:ribonuclease VapC
MTVGRRWVSPNVNWYCTVRTTSPLAVWETVLAVARVLGPEIRAANTAVKEILVLAGVDAFDRFGKGRHPAALNFGDCFAYACARQAAR